MSLEDIFIIQKATTLKPDNEYPLMCYSTVVNTINTSQY